MKVLREMRNCNYNFPYPISKSNEMRTRRESGSEALSRLSISFPTGEEAWRIGFNIYQSQTSIIALSSLRSTLGCLVEGKSVRQSLSQPGAKWLCLWAEGLWAAGAGSCDLPLEDRPWLLTPDLVLWPLRGERKRTFCHLKMSFLFERTWGTERQVDVILWVSTELTTEGDNASFCTSESCHFRGKDTEAQDTGSFILQVGIWKMCKMNK